VRSQCGDFTVTAKVGGDIPSPAINAPLTEDALRDRLYKMGNTPFSLSREDIELDFDGNINLSPSAINGLRRLAVAELEAQLSRRIDQIIGQGSDTPPTLTVKSQSFKGKAPKRTALFLDADLLSDLLTADRKRPSGIEVAFVPLEAYEGLAAKHPGAVTGVYLPPVITESQWDEARALLLRARELGAEYALAGNISHLSLARSVGISVIGDFRLNIANSDTASVYAYMGVEYAILSTELTLPMARDIGGSVITMGRIPLMLTERCFVKENFGCKACGKASFSDRTGAEFPIMKEWGHRNLILNSMPTYMGDKRREVTDVALGEHFIFSKESSGEVGRMLNSYFEGKPMSSPHRRLGSRRSNEKNKKNK
jgi:putative protease